MQLQIKQQKKQEASKHPSRPAAAAYINAYMYIDTGRHGAPRRSAQAVDAGRVGPSWPQVFGRQVIGEKWLPR